MTAYLAMLAAANPPTGTAPVVYIGLAVVAGIVIGIIIGRMLASRVQPAEPPKPATPPKPSGAPLRLLALFQREGRLLDFLMEDVQGYQDAQIGAAVRDIHRNCRKVIQDHLVLDPVLKESEGASVTVPVGFDPSAIRLTGNVTGQPPFAGTLQHHGWRVKEIKIGSPPAGQDEFILQPAEVELA